MTANKTGLEKLDEYLASNHIEVPMTIAIKIDDFLSEEQSVKVGSFENWLENEFESRNKFNEDLTLTERHEANILEVVLSKYRQLKPKESELVRELSKFEVWFSDFVANRYDKGELRKEDPCFEVFIRFRNAMEHIDPTR